MPETIKRPPGPEIPREFTIGGALTKAWKEVVKAADGTESEQMFLSGVASSSVRDRQGDTITAQCQAMMLEQLQAGIGRDGHALTMFLNHEYKVPEDVLGNVNDSRLAASAPEGNEDAVIDLEIVCRVTSENPRAVQAWKIVNDGISLGYSIGGSITDWEVDEENDDGESWCPPMLINGMSLWEISLCGIPANQRAYTEALKSAPQQEREKALAAAHRFLRELGVDDEAPEPSHNWAKDARQTLVRRASRSPEVRDTLRGVLARSRGTLGEPARTITMHVRLSPEQMDDAARDAVAKTLADASFRVGETAYHLALAPEPHEPAAGESDCAWKDGCDDKNAAGSLLCEAHKAEVPIGKDVADSNSLGPKTQSAVAAAIGNLDKAKDHGGCADVMNAIGEAHKSLIGLLDPEFDDPEDPDDQDDWAASIARIKALPKEQRAQVVAAVAEVAKDATRVVRAVEPAFDNELAAKREELAALTKSAEDLGADITTRKAEAEALTKTIDDATAEKKRLDDLIEQLKSTPTGRRTAGSNGGGTHAETRTPFQIPDDELAANLSRAMNGSGDDNPAQRPA